ncbi:HTH domain-containing protein [Enterobacter sp. RHBSTW-00175]|uniref:HTH domain-containing protein n=1 Tax=Enterobacter sp. RHBSTW-00175 TaxID=2742639 RepID=UPI00217525B7|nr:HTH domain-containing protein [Enterobacter sp. RHBSTW-00175]
MSRRELASRFNVSERTIYRDLNRMGAFLSCSQDGIYHISLLNEAEDKLPSLTCLSEKTGMGELLPLPAESLNSDLQKRIYPRWKKPLKSVMSASCNTRINRGRCIHTAL